MESPREQAQRGFEMIKDATLDLLRQHTTGETAGELGKALGLHQSRRSGQNGYVVWSALGHLMAEGKVAYNEETRIYTVTYGA